MYQVRKQFSYSKINEKNKNKNHDTLCDNQTYHAYMTTIVRVESLTF